MVPVPAPQAGTAGGTAWAAPPATLLPAVRRALAGEPGRVAMLLPSLAPHPRRAARLLLAEAARAGDGLLLEEAGGQLLLLGCLPAAADRAAGMLGHLGLPSGQHHSLEEDADALLAWAEQALPAPRTGDARMPPEETAPDAIPLEAVVAWRNVLRLGPGVEPACLARRATVSRRRLAAALGSPFAAEPELLDRATARVEARLAVSPEAAAPGVLPAPPMLRPGPADAAPPAPGATAILPLARAAEPGSLAAHRAALLAAGWGEVGLDGLDAALLCLIDPAGLPAQGPLLLRWSPALGDRAAMAALRGYPDLARLVLTGCDDTEALSWGIEAGIRQFCGAAVEALVETARATPARMVPA